MLLDPPLDPEAVLIQKESYEQLLMLISKVLTSKERHVLAQRYGLDCDAKTLQQIAEDLGTSRTWPQQIEQKAIRKLRHPASLRLLGGTRADIDRLPFDPFYKPVWITQPVMSQPQPTPKTKEQLDAEWEAQRQREWERYKRHLQERGWNPSAEWIRVRSETEWPPWPGD